MLILIQCDAAVGLDNLVDQLLLRDRVMDVRLARLKSTHQIITPKIAIPVLPEGVVKSGH
jgi:hypothetical protein